MQIIFTLRDAAQQLGIDLKHPAPVAKLAAYREALEALKQAPLPGLNLTPDNIRTWNSQIDTATQAHARRETIDRFVSPGMVTAARSAENAAYWQHADHYIGQIAPHVAEVSMPEQMPLALAFANALATRNSSKLAPIAALTSVPDQIEKQVIHGDENHSHRATPDQLACRRIYDAVHHGHLAAAIEEIVSGRFSGFTFSPAESMDEFTHRVDQLENGSTTTRTVPQTPVPQVDLKVTRPRWP